MPVKFQPFQLAFQLIELLERKQLCFTKSILNQQQESLSFLIHKIERKDRKKEESTRIKKGKRKEGRNRKEIGKESWRIK